MIKWISRIFVLFSFLVNVKNLNQYNILTILDSKRISHEYKIKPQFRCVSLMFLILT